MGEIDLGRVAPGGTSSFILSIDPQLDEDMVIEAISRTCNCTSARPIGSEIITAHQPLALEVATTATTGAYGEKIAVISLLLSGSDGAKVELHQPVKFIVCDEADLGPKDELDIDVFDPLVGAQVVLRNRGDSTWTEAAVNVVGSDGAEMWYIKGSLDDGSEGAQFSRFDLSEVTKSKFAVNDSGVILPEGSITFKGSFYVSEASKPLKLVKKSSLRFTPTHPVSVRPDLLLVGDGEETKIVHFFLKSRNSEFSEIIFSLGEKTVSSSMVRKSQNWVQIEIPSAELIFDGGTADLKAKVVLNSGESFRSKVVLKISSLNRE